MTSIDTALMQQNVYEASAMLKSLANPSRLIVLCALVAREHTAGELEELTGLSQPAISQHLARLRAEHIVDTRRDAQRVFYSLADPRVQALLETLHGIFCAEP